MPQVFCEICGGTDIVKAEGVFQCRDCGCKYSIDEMRNLVAIQTSNDFDNDKQDDPADISSLLDQIDIANNEQNYSEIKRLADKVLAIEPDNFPALLQEAYAHCFVESDVHTIPIHLWLRIEDAITALHDEFGDSDRYYEMFDLTMNSYESMVNVVSARINNETSSDYDSTHKKVASLQRLLKNYERFYKLSDELVEDNSHEPKSFRERRSELLENLRFL